MSTSAGLGTPGKTLRRWEDSEGGENKGGIEGRPGPGWPEKEEAREETESDRFLGALSSPCLRFTGGGWWGGFNLEEAPVPLRWSCDASTLPPTEATWKCACVCVGTCACARGFVLISGLGVGPAMLNVLPRIRGRGSSEQGCLLLCHAEGSAPEGQSAYLRRTSLDGGETH